MAVGATTGKRDGGLVTGSTGKRDGRLITRSTGKSEGGLVTGSNDVTTGKQEVGLVSGGNDAARGKQVLGLVVTGAVKAKSAGVKLGAAVGTRNGETASRTFLDDDPLFLSNMITTTVTMITMATATALMNHLVKKVAFR
jgi:hypothetical protein